MHVNFREKITKWNFLCPIKNWWLDIPLRKFQHILRKKVQEVEKNTPITLIRVVFFTNYSFFSKYAEIAFIFFLTTNFHLGIKNPILGIFSRKFTRKYGFHI